MFKDKTEEAVKQLKGTMDELCVGDCKRMLLWSALVAVFAVLSLSWSLHSGTVQLEQGEVFVQVVQNLIFVSLAFVFVIYNEITISGSVRLPWTQQSPTQGRRKVDKMLEARFVVINPREGNRQQLTWCKLLAKYNAEIAASIVSYTLSITCCIFMLFKTGILGWIVMLLTVLLFSVINSSAVNIIKSEILVQRLRNARKDSPEED